MDNETRRKKQQALMVRLVERQVRSRAQQLYETRGTGDGQDLQDWFQAEAEVLDKNVVAPLYYRMRVGELSADSTLDPMHGSLPEISSSETLAPADRVGSETIA